MQPFSIDIDLSNRLLYTGLSVETDLFNTNTVIRVFSITAGLQVRLRASALCS
jgi:hypothetical protein